MGSQTFRLAHTSLPQQQVHGDARSRAGRKSDIAAVLHALGGGTTSHQGHREESRGCFKKVNEGGETPASPLAFRVTPIRLLRALLLPGCGV